MKFNFCGEDYEVVFVDKDKMLNPENYCEAYKESKTIRFNKGLLDPSYILEEEVENK